MKKVYISPSTQENNIGIGDYGTEEYQMNIIADHLIPMLERCGFSVRRNKPEMSLRQVVVDSNAWCPDAHVAIHSNAGGGQGTEVWYYTGSVKGQKLAECLYNEVASLSPGKDRGIKNKTNFYELSQTIAPAIIIEVGFHDYMNDALWIKDAPKQIARAIAKGICNYFEVRFKELDREHELLLENSRLRAQNEAMRQDLKRICGIVSKYQIS